MHSTAWIRSQPHVVSISPGSHTIRAMGAISGLVSHPYE
jgi:hypothetical protein